MSIMVNRLYKSGMFLYKMELLAGRDGLSNPVHWVHIIEDENVTLFLHGGELVFTAGLRNSEDDWLLKFTRNVYEAGASALVVNIGPHTKRVQQEVIDYCDQVNLPLFTIPWETNMADMTRNFCHMIIRNEQDEDTIVTTLKNILFSIGDLETEIMRLERYGYQRDGKFCFVSMSMGSANGTVSDEKLNRIKAMAEKMAKNVRELYTAFTYHEKRILVLANYTESEIKDFVADLIITVKKELPDIELHIGVSSNQAGLYNQNTNFEKALSAMEMACKCGEPVRYYDKLGIYKLLYALNDKSVMKEYYSEVIGKLEKYDRDNHTQLMQILKSYIDNNGSLQLVSEKQYVHRNTVTNQLKKIESITGYNPLDLSDKVKFSVGFYIKDIL